MTGKTQVIDSQMKSTCYTAMKNMIINHNPGSTAITDTNIYDGVERYWNINCNGDASGLTTGTLYFAGLAYPQLFTWYFG